MTTPGVKPGLSRPQRDVLTTRRCGLLAAEVLLQFVGCCNKSCFGRVQRKANLGLGASANNRRREKWDCGCCTSAFYANQSGNCQCNHQRCNSNICDCCSLRLFKDERRFLILKKIGNGEIAGALLKRPCYFDIVGACSNVATLIVDCTCTGSLLQ